MADLIQMAKELAEMNSSPHQSVELRDIRPILRAFVECEHWIDGVCELIETSDFAPTGEPRLAEEAQGGRTLLKRIRGEA